MSIQAGDLVMVVKPTSCCRNESGLGLLFIVSDIETGLMNCLLCKKIFYRETYACRMNSEYGYHLGRLKKIDPLPADETVERDIMEPSNV